MNIKNKFPHPVLGCEDDITPLPKELELKVTPAEKIGGCHKVEFSIDIENDDILDLIAEGKAEYVCSVDCPSTFYRKVHHQNLRKFIIEIPENSVANGVWFEVMILVSENIKGYTNKGFNEDYDGFVFDLEPGDLLAYIGRFDFNASVRYADLEKPESYMQFLVDPKLCDGETKVMLNEKHININISQDIREKYY